MFFLCTIALRVALTAAQQQLVAAYLCVPDRWSTGRGMVAGGALSPLLAALYLDPLDRPPRPKLSSRSEPRQQIRYFRA